MSWEQIGPKWKDWPDELNDGLCRGKPTEWWFPNRGDTQRSPATVAVAICRRCPVRDVCLEYSLAEPFTEDGIWGGLLARPRERIRTERARAKKVAA